MGVVLHGMDELRDECRPEKEKEPTHDQEARSPKRRAFGNWLTDRWSLRALVKATEAERG